MLCCASLDDSPCTLQYDLTEDNAAEFYGILEAASKNIGKKEFANMPTKKIFVTSYHSKKKFDPEQRKKIREWGLTAANLPYPRDKE